MPAAGAGGWLRPATERGRYALASVALVLTALFWSSNTIVVRGLRDEAPPIGLAAWRWALAVLVLAPFAWPALRRERARVLQHWKPLVGAGVVGIALFTTVLFTAIQNTVAINSGLMSATQPVWVALVARIVLGERLRRWQWAGLAVAFFGAAVIVTQGHLAQIDAVRLHLGDLLYLVALMVWGVYSVILQKLAGHLDIRVVLLVTSAVGVVAMVPMAVVEGFLVHPLPLTWEVAGAVVYGAVFAAVGAFGMWNLGVALIGANAASFFMYLVPVFTGFFAVTLLGETLHLFHLVGAAFILAGVLVATRGARARRRRD